MTTLPPPSLCGMYWCTSRSQRRTSNSPFLPFCYSLEKGSLIKPEVRLVTGSLNEHPFSTLYNSGVTGGNMDVPSLGQGVWTLVCASSALTHWACPYVLCCQDKKWQKQLLSLAFNGWAVVPAQQKQLLRKEEVLLFMCSLEKGKHHGGIVRLLFTLHL